eukprot:359335-Chlamydomonas_euryale.AAC.5
MHACAGLGCAACSGGRCGGLVRATGIASDALVRDDPLASPGSSKRVSLSHLSAHASRSPPLPLR